MPPDVLAMREAAALFGISKQAFAKLVARHSDFPKHTELSIGRIWDRAEVVAWSIKHGRAFYDADGRRVVPLDPT